MEEKSRLSRIWLPVSVILVIIILGAGVVAWIRYTPPQPIEISLSPSPNSSGQIYIGGNVESPGYYPFIPGEDVAAIIRKAGGTSGNIAYIQLLVGGSPVPAGSQKIDINHAETWLLEALPGIGQTLAQRIVDYRQTNGPFSNTEQLMEVSGVTPAIYDKVKLLIAVTPGG